MKTGMEAHHSWVLAATLALHAGGSTAVAQAQESVSGAQNEAPAALTSPAPAYTGDGLTDKEMKFGGESYPLRQGFSVELGVGGGVNYGRSEQRSAGPSLVNFGIGGFLSESFALLAHFAVFVPAGGSDDPGLLWIGPQLQWWPNDRLTMALGVGFEGDAADPGVGLSLKAGYALWLGERHTIRIAVNSLPARKGTDVVFTQLFLVEWQSH